MIVKNIIKYAFKLLMICVTVCKNIIYSVCGGVAVPFHSSICLYTKIEKIGDCKIIIGNNVSIMGKGKTRASNGILHIGDGCDFRDVRISANKGHIEIGNNTFLNSGCIITSCKSIKIGCGCAFGTNVSIYDHDHIYCAEGKQDWNITKSSEIVIGDNCWIGCNVIILRGSHIGNNCVIGAGTVIKGDIPDSMIVYDRSTQVVKKIQE